MQLLSHAVLTVSLVASLLWGLIYSHCVRMALFFKIVLFGEGCILLGELFTVAMYVCLAFADKWLCNGTYARHLHGDGGIRHFLCA